MSERWFDCLETNIFLQPLMPPEEKGLPVGCRVCPTCQGAKGYYRYYPRTWLPCEFCDGRGWVRL